MTENHQLSEREIEILRLVATGVSNKEIAQELVISVNTVKVHLRNIFSKLDVSSRTEATIYAVQNGLVPSPSLAQPEQDVPDETSGHLSGRNRNILIGLLIIFALITVVLAGLVGYNWWLARNQSIEVSVKVQELEQDRWEEQKEMINPRSNFATSVVDGEIYVIGGESGQKMTTQIDRYRVDTDSWDIVTNLPRALSDIQAVTIGGKIFVPGGRLEDGDLSRQLLIYDPEEERWQEAAQLPVAVSAYSLVAHEGKLYLFGGWDGVNYVSAVWRYDPSIDKWESLTSMPTARGFAGAGVSGGEIHVVGGYDGEDVLATHEVYTPDQDDEGGNPWGSLAPLPEARYRGQIVSVAEIIHLIGGANDLGNNLQSFKYFSQNDEWEGFLIPMDDSWVDLGVEIVGEHIYILGGHVGTQQTDQQYSYRAVYLIMVPILP